MITYNTTFVVEPANELRFIAFLREEYIPGHLSHGVLSAPQLKRIHQHSPEDDTVSLALSFEAEDADKLSTYLSSERGMYAPKRLTELFGASVIGFSTILQHIAIDSESGL